MGERAALIDVAFEPVSSNRILRCGETGFFRAEIKRPKWPWRFKTTAQRQNLARQPRQFGVIAGCREIPFGTRMHGGPGKTRTSTQAVMTDRIGARFRKSACGGSSLIRTLGIPI